MTHDEALAFLTRIGAEQTGPDRWTLNVGTGTILIDYDDRPIHPPGARWRAKPTDNEVDSCLAADPQQALLDLGADLSDMASHCSGMGLAITRLAV